MQVFININFVIVRHKVKEILEMIQDDSRLRDERKRAKKNKDKYVGMSNDLIEDSFYSKYGELLIILWSTNGTNNNTKLLLNAP